MPTFIYFFLFTVAHNYIIRYKILRFFHQLLFHLFFLWVAVAFALNRWKLSDYLLRLRFLLSVRGPPLLSRAEVHVHWAIVLTGCRRWDNKDGDTPLNSLVPLRWRAKQLHLIFGLLPLASSTVIIGNFLSLLLLVARAGTLLHLIRWHVLLLVSFMDGVFFRSCFFWAAWDWNIISLFFRACYLSYASVGIYLHLLLIVFSGLPPFYFLSDLRLAKTLLSSLFLHCALWRCASWFFLLIYFAGLRYLRLKILTDVVNNHNKTFVIGSTFASINILYDLAIPTILLSHWMKLGLRLGEVSNVLV